MNALTRISHGAFLRSLALAALGVCVACTFTGCAGIGGMIENYKRESTHSIAPEYTGLAGKSFAVVVTADRSIQAQHPLLVETIMNRVTQRLSDAKNMPKAAGFVPASTVAAYQYKTPGWTGKSLSELGRQLGNPQRLIFIEVSEFRLHEPGNQYEWNGAASGRVAIAELDSATPDDYAFQKNLAMTFPDKKGVSTTDMPENLITSELLRRIVDRTVWPLVKHEEPYYPKY